MGIIKRPPEMKRIGRSIGISTENFICFYVATICLNSLSSENLCFCFNWLEIDIFITFQKYMIIVPKEIFRNLRE